MKEEAPFQHPRSPKLGSLAGVCCTAAQLDEHTGRQENILGRQENIPGRQENIPGRQDIILSYKVPTWTLSII